MTDGAKIRILLCDDSRLIRQLFLKLLTTKEDFVVVGEAGNGRECLDLIHTAHPDVVLLDLAMPVMDGFECLKEAKRTDADVAFLVVSTNAHDEAPGVLDALRRGGAVDYVTKAKGILDMGPISHEVCQKIRIAYQVIQDRRARSGAPRPRKETAPVPTTGAAATSAAGPRKPCVTVVGGSSGSLQVLPELLQGVSKESQGTVVVYLKVPEFVLKHLVTTSKATSPIPIKLAEHGKPLEPSCIHVAPGEKSQVRVVRSGPGVATFEITPLAGGADPDSGPIDVLMVSVAEAYGISSQGVLISGMGLDGIQGLRVIAASGGTVMVQERDGALAWGTIQEAIRQGVVPRGQSLRDIAARL